MLITCATLALEPRRDGRVWRVVRLDALVGITVTGVVHWFLLRPLLELDGMSYVTDKLLHVAVPLLAVIAGRRSDPGRASTGTSCCRRSAGRWPMSHTRWSPVPRVVGTRTRSSMWGCTATRPWCSTVSASWSCFSPRAARCSCSTAGCGPRRTPSTSEQRRQRRRGLRRLAYRAGGRVRPRSPAVTVVPAVSWPSAASMPRSPVRKRYARPAITAPARGASQQAPRNRGRAPIGDAQDQRNSAMTRRGIAHLRGSV